MPGSPTGHPSVPCPLAGVFLSFTEQRRSHFPDFRAEPQSPLHLSVLVASCLSRPHPHRVLFLTATIKSVHPSTPSLKRGGVREGF